MPLTAVEAGAFVHHLALTSPDPGRLAAFYADALDMQAEPHGEGILLSGPERRLLLSPGPPRTIAHVGMAVRDAEALEAVVSRLALEGLQAEPFDGALYMPGAVAVTDPDGHRIVFGCACASPPRHGISGRLQHVTFATRHLARFEAFYAGRLGFAVSDRVVRTDGTMTTSFLRANHEHHTFGAFLQDRDGLDHMAFEAADWGVLKTWCDRFAGLGIAIDWGPGRHGPGNNLFAFITDPDGNWIEISTELEVIYDRPARDWPHAEATLNLWGPGRLRV